MAEPSSPGALKDNKLWKGVFAVAGIMITLVSYGVLQVYMTLLPSFRHLLICIEQFSFATFAFDFGFEL